MVVLVVQGKEYQLNEQQAAAMKYVIEAEALENGKITITNIAQPTFETILQILDASKYNIKEPPKLKNNVLADHVQADLLPLLEGLDHKQINTLYRAAHELKIYPLRRCLAAVMACRVWIEPTIENYKKKKDEIGLTQELTTEKSKEYKERFPFMN